MHKIDINNDRNVNNARKLGEEQKIAQIIIIILMFGIRIYVRKAGHGTRFKRNIYTLVYGNNNDNDDKEYQKNENAKRTKKEKRNNKKNHSIESPFIRFNWQTLYQTCINSII